MNYLSLFKYNYFKIKINEMKLILFLTGRARKNYDKEMSFQYRWLHSALILSPGRNWTRRHFIVVIPTTTRPFRPYSCLQNHRQMIK